jgi:hypothetical protein
MTHTNLKKLEIKLPTEVYKIIKLKASEENQSVQEWITTLVEAAIQTAPQSDISALDWGRIDSRIDQRTAMLEQQVDRLSVQIEQLLTKQRLQESLVERSLLSGTSIS